MEEERAVTLYLTSWQKRMLRDFSRLKQIQKVTKVTIRPGRVGCLTSYKLPPGGMRKDDWLIYLTDEQMVSVTEQLKLRTPIASVNVTADAMKTGSIVFS